jgi:selenophosphate synthetase-related protein
VPARSRGIMRAMKKTISSRPEMSGSLQVTLTVKQDCLVVKTGDNEIIIPKESPLFQAVEKSTDKAATLKAILVIAQVAHFKADQDLTAKQEKLIAEVLKLQAQKTGRFGVPTVPANLTELAGSFS